MTYTNKPKRINFCTIVSPDEYDFVADFEAGVDAANRFHKIDIKEECPPPYFPFDTGKVYGLVLEILNLKEENERLNKELKKLKGDADETIT